ncbi:MAG: 5'-methylthioadenosine/S-adenosylhomocysteine nucleosidase [Bacilli bacterium]|nr:5'-methylthioadenosine/S-adenosylhomocysteine nucleosidase [Bacilli bacterium]
MQKIKYIMLSTLFLSLGVFTSCNKPSYDVMVVGVNNGKGWEETSILINSLENKKEEKIDNISFHIGKINNKQVVVVESPIGTSEAAMTTTIGIKQYAPKYVISEGTAGGHHDNINVNDIVLGKDILDISSFKGPGDDPSAWEGKYNGLEHPTLQSNENLLKIASEVKCEKVGHITVNGVISSSDCWNTSVDFVNKLYGRYKEDCEEMESYAVANVCKHYNIPSLAIRVISNNLMLGSEEGEPGEYNPEAGKNGQYYTIDVIKAI